MTTMLRLLAFALVAGACSSGQRSDLSTPRIAATDGGTQGQMASAPADASSGKVVLAVKCVRQPPCACGTTRTTERTTYPYPKTRHGEIVWCERADGTKHGRWRETWPTGKTKSEGRYADGKRNGAWVEYYLKGRRYKKYRLVHGVEDGESTVWHPTGAVAARHFFKSGQAVGVWRSWHRNGNIESEAHWINGKLHGSDTRYNEAGKRGDIYVYDSGNLTRHDRYKNGKVVKSRPPRDRTDPDCEPDFDEICDD